MTKKIITIFFGAFLFSGAVFGQLLRSGSYSETHVPSNGFISVFGEHSFTDIGYDKSVIHTKRNTSKSYVVFAGSKAKWQGASEDGFVDGLVKVYSDGPFLLPTGQGEVYLPIGVGQAYGVIAEFINADPSIKVSNKFGDKLEEGSLSSIGFWNVEGRSSSNVVLTWNANTEIDKIVKNFEELTIAGFDGEKWIAIPSMVDSKSIDFTKSDLVVSNRQSDFNKGSIRSTTKLDLSKFHYFTLAKGASQYREGGDIALAMYPNPAVENNLINIDYEFSSLGGEIIISSLNDRNVYSKKIFDNKGNLKITTDNIDSGVYWVMLRDNNGKKVHKKLILLDATSVSAY